MKYLCLIYLSEEELDAMPAPELDAINAAHLDLNDELRASGHLVEAEALAPAKTALVLRVRRGKTSVVDGPFTEAKEVVAGFYLIEAADMEEAAQIVSRIPSATFGTIEIRATRQLIVPGREMR